MKKKIGIFFPLSGRLLNFDNRYFVKEPKEFYYGIDFIFKSYKTEYDLKFIDSRAKPDKLLHIFLVYLNRFVNRFTNFKFSMSRVEIAKKEILKNDVLISFTDSGSLSIGTLASSLKKRPYFIGGFHGLSDCIEDVPFFLRNLYKKMIGQSLKGLDHIFFFGDADRKKCIKIFGISEKKTSTFRHSVDTNFWSPRKVKLNKSIFSVGSDPRRDYETLIKSQKVYQVKILTKLNLKNLILPSHISVIQGSFHEKGISNIQLRDLYNSATIVVVPIKNVLQPSGYSVTMQALACGRPVILPAFRGLWDKESFKHMENCILYKPEDPKDLGEKINLIMQDKVLQKKISRNARKLALEVFNLQRTNNDLLNLIKMY